MAIEKSPSRHTLLSYPSRLGTFEPLHVDEEAIRLDEIGHKDAAGQWGERIRRRAEKANGNLLKFATRRDKIEFLLGLLFLTICNTGVAYYNYRLGVVLHFIVKTTDRKGLLKEALILVALLVLSYVAQGSGTYVQQRLAERQVYRIKKATMNRVLDMDVAWNSEANGKLTSMIDEACRNIREALGMQMTRFMQFTVSLVAGLAIGMAGIWQITLVTISVTVVLTPLVVWLMFLEQNCASNTVQSSVSAIGLAKEVFSAPKPIVTFSLQRYMLNKVDELLNKAVAVGATEAKVQGMGYAVRDLVRLGTLLTGSVFSGYMVWSSDDPAKASETAIATFMCATNPAFLISSIGPALSAMTKGVGSMKIVSAIVDHRPDPLEAAHVYPPITDLRGDIEFRNVVFGYTPDKRILNGVSFKIMQGENVAFVGPSGSGKSTIMNLLCQLITLQPGTRSRILIDKRDLDEYNPEELRKYVSVVSQEPRLFGMSILENIRIGNPDATDEEVIEAAKKAHADKFISSLPNGYDTQCGSGSSLFSGGQKQRITIARAFLRKPRILILDEATSALDNESERIVLASLKAIINELKCTTISIAHRLTTVKDSDRIYVLRNAEGTGSQIAEMGTHRQLLAMKGVYYGLCMSDEAIAKEAAAEAEGSTSDGESVASASVHSTWPEDDVVDISKPRPTVVTTEAEGPAEPGTADLSGFQRFKGAIKTARKIAPGTFYTAFIGSALIGAVPVGSGWLFGYISSIVSDDDVERVRFGAKLVGYLYAGLLVISVTVNWVGWSGFGKLVYEMQRHMRHTIVDHVVYKDIAFFDRTDNNPGRLCEVLSTDVLNVSHWVGEPCNIYMQTLVGLCVGVAASFGSSWIIALVSCAMWGAIIPSCLFLARLHQETASKNAVSPAEILNETLDNILVVNLYTMKPAIRERYDQAIHNDLLQAYRGCWSLALVSGFTTGMPFIGEIVLMLVSGNLVMTGLANPAQAFACIYSVGFVAWIFASAAATAAPMRTANTASRKYLRLVENRADEKINVSMRAYHDHVERRDRLFKRKQLSLRKQTELEELNNELNVAPLSVETIEFRDVSFCYPTRPNNLIYKSVSFKVTSGMVCAFVGPSGCGKSTAVQLLDRFYDLDPGAGEILINDRNVQEYPLHQIRSAMSMVLQEPILFTTTVEENIAIGSEKEVSLAEIQRVSDLANANEFIVQLPEGFQYNVGARGRNLSGGQKQRVSIARALIRHPQILILDEATSALDNESERLVQQSLDELLEKKHGDYAPRVVFVIAHRLSTIIGSDTLIVLNNEGDGSVVVQTGSHTQLKAVPGIYRDLLEAAQ